MVGPSNLHRFLSHGHWFTSMNSSCIINQSWFHKHTIEKAPRSLPLFVNTIHQPELVSFYHNSTIYELQTIKDSFINHNPIFSHLEIPFLLHRAARLRARAIARCWNPSRAIHTAAWQKKTVSMGWLKGNIYKETIDFPIFPWYFHGMFLYFFL